MSEILIENQITLTEKSATQLKKIREENKITENQFLRIGVKGGGCSGFSYILAFEENKKESDIEVEQFGIKIIVDPKSLFILDGTILDFADGLSGKGFVFNNPKATKTCGCGNSFGV